LDALHGKSLHAQHEYKLKHIHRYKSILLAGFSLEVHRDLRFYLQSWEGANEVMEQFRHGEKVIFKLSVQYVRWMARHSLHLWEDYQALEWGSDTILCDYIERWIHVN